MTASETIDIKIPGINLLRVIQGLTDAADLYRSVTAQVPDSVAGEGYEAANTYRRLILRGYSEMDAARLITAPAMQESISKQRNLARLEERYGFFSAIPRAYTLAILQHEETFLDRNGELYIRQNCQTFGTACQEIRIDPTQPVAKEQMVALLQRTFSELEGYDALIRAGRGSEIASGALVNASMKRDLAIRCVLEWTASGGSLDEMRLLVTQNRQVILNAGAVGSGALKPAVLSMALDSAVAMASGNTAEVIAARNAVLAERERAMVSGERSALNDLANILNAAHARLVAGETPQSVALTWSHDLMYHSSIFGQTFGVSASGRSGKQAASYEVVIEAAFIRDWISIAGSKKANSDADFIFIPNAQELQGSTSSNSPSSIEINGPYPSSATQGSKLNEHLRQLQDYGKAGYKELENGRIRYYGELELARDPGVMVGRRLVREWDPETGNYRTWHETLDANGTVRIVRPQTDGPKVHFLFDANGKFIGTR